MANKRKRVSPEKKIEILQEVLENNRKITDVAEQYGVHPNVICKWKKLLFEGAVSTFEQKKPAGAVSSTSKKIQNLEKTLQTRDSLIAELVSENVILKKKENGEY